MIQRLRNWIDAKEHRPLTASLVIIMTPVIAGLWVTTAMAGAPWYTMPVALGAIAVIVGWTALVVAALGVGK
jgi:hypothetical protein